LLIKHKFYLYQKSITFLSKIKFYLYKNQMISLLNIKFYLYQKPHSIFIKKSKFTFIKNLKNQILSLSKFYLIFAINYLDFFNKLKYKF